MVRKGSRVRVSFRASLWPQPSGPDLDGVADANAVGLPYVVIGGFAVIAPIAGLRSIVGFKRLAGRPQDRRDLEELESFYGKLPEDEIPGLDS